MSDDLMAAQARAAGLDKALAQFPDDVRVAFDQARRTGGGVPSPENPVAEPWPPMQAGPNL